MEHKLCYLFHISCVYANLDILLLFHELPYFYRARVVIRIDVRTILPLGLSLIKAVNAALSGNLIPNGHGNFGPCLWLAQDHCERISFLIDD